MYDKSRIKEKGGRRNDEIDNAKYRTVLNLIKKTGEFKGKAVPSKARLHEMIGDALGISHNNGKGLGKKQHQMGQIREFQACWNSWKHIWNYRRVDCGKEQLNQLN